MKKNTPQTQTRDLGGFVLRICIHKKMENSTVTIESVSKNWKVVFGAMHAGAGVILRRHQEDNQLELEGIARCLYAATGCMLTDQKFADSVVSALTDHSARTMDKTIAPAEETEKEILTQERLKEEARQAILS